MNDTEFPEEEFTRIAQPLIGLEVSEPWKGYGSAVFFELGRLAPGSYKNSEGEACIAVEWDWRVESGTTVLFGSSNSGPKIKEGIQALRGATVQSLSVSGQVPELIVHFSNGYCLRSMVMVTGDPEWSIKLPTGDWVYAMAGSLRIGEGGSTSTEEEEAAWDLAKRTVERWGVPSVEPKAGQCGTCAFSVRIDGEGSLLDYGVCVASDGPLDGHAVSRTSGCPRFEEPSRPLGRE
jgi:hypothetical protein